MAPSLLVYVLSRSIGGKIARTHTHTRTRTLVTVVFSLSRFFPTGHVAQGNSPRNCVKFWLMRMQKKKVFAILTNKRDVNSDLGSLEV